MTADTNTGPVLITGAGGQLGTALRSAFASRGLRCVTLARADLDISVEDDVTRVVEDRAPAVVINAAAYTAVDKAESEPDIANAVNRDGAAFLAAACARRNVPLLHVSTDYVFDGQKDTAYTEDDEPHPLGVYGQSKLDGELRVRHDCPKHLILRVGWLFGVTGSNFVKTMVRLARERGALRVVDDQRGSPTAASHVADVVVQMTRRALDAEFDAWGTYHYADAPATTWCGFARAVVDEAVTAGLLDRRVPVEPIATVEYPTPAQRPKYAVLCCDRIKNVFDVGQRAWLDGLRHMLNNLPSQGEAR